MIRTVVLDRRATNRLALLAVLAAACGSEQPAAAPSQSPIQPFVVGPLAAVLIVSDPSVPPGSLSPSPPANAAGPTVVYVSLPPGNLPDPATVRILNFRTGDAVIPEVVAGGFDPVVIPGVAGDTLDVTVTDGTGATSHTPVVAVRARPPRVVRTSPPKGQNDVPLNLVIVIVISEPIDPATLNANAIRLRLGAETVAGSLALDPSGMVVRFTPELPLLPNAAYELDVTQAITDLSGAPLAAPTTVPFTTDAALPATHLAFIVQPTTTGAGLILLPTVFVNVQDAFGKTIKGFTGTISLALSANVGGATLSGTTTVAAGEDGAEFTDLRISQVGSGYTLVATASGLTGATSVTFDITPTSQIAFASDRDGDWEIYLMNADGSGVTQLTDNPAVDGNPAWSPDGTRIAFTSDRDGNSEIYVMNADGSGVTQVTNDPAWDSDAAWSPDGSRLAFASDRGSSFDIYVMNADGSRVTRITNDLARETEPTWSPDGARIAFTSLRDNYTIDEGYEIFVMNADGSGVTDLTNGQGGWQPAWSPDGSKIVYGNGRSVVGIYVMNADGSAVAPVALGVFGPASWSPDGLRIACTSGLGDDPFVTICVMNADGSAVNAAADWNHGISIVTGNYGTAADPAWRPRPRR